MQSITVDFPERGRPPHSHDSPSFKRLVNFSYYLQKFYTISLKLKKIGWAKLHFFKNCIDMYFSKGN